MRDYDKDTEIILEFFTTREIIGEPVYNRDDYRMWTEYPALWYRDTCYIDILEDEYDLIIESQEWSSQCLERLEIRLARFMVEEGYIDRDEFLTRRDDMLGRNIAVKHED